MIRGCAFAPALEHGNNSNNKENDGADAEDLQQHDRTPLSFPRAVNPENRIDTAATCQCAQ